MSQNYTHTTTAGETTMGSAIPFNEQKFRELLLYIASRSEDDPNFGATKINKILFFSDFEAYARFGKPITGAVYQRLPQGPAPRAMLPIKRSMTENRDIIEREVLLYSNYRQKRLIANRNPNMSLFSAEEISLVDEVIADNINMNARGVSDKSHELDSWQLAVNLETIPYQSALLHDGPVELNEEHVAYYQAMIERSNANAVLV